MLKAKMDVLHSPSTTRDNEKAVVRFPHTVLKKLTIDICILYVVAILNVIVRFC